MIKNTTIKAVTFDVGNVLVRWDPRNAYAPLFQNKSDLDHFLNNICSLEWHTNHDRGMSFADNIRVRQKKFPEHAPMIGLYESIWDDMFGGIIEETVTLLHQLHAQNIPLFALTNFPAGKYDDFQEKYDFTALFQDAIVSGVEKITKPDPRLYQILLDRAGIPPEHILFIDDRLENLKPAEELGLQTHHFVGADNLKEFLQKNNILSC
ncbi:MAG: HAD family hydrolase [Alphaproteobacteria bacterium]|nr:MAG: HAD family hydrolase [Alphaproteobacteria bacterium]